jgi:hypothetical protein
MISGLEMNLPVLLNPELDLKLFKVKFWGTGQWSAHGFSRTVEVGVASKND